MERALRGRLDAAQHALRGKEGHVAELISSTQAAAVAEVVAKEPGLTSLSATVRASLVDLAAQGQWQQADLTKVLELLRPPDKTAKTPKKRVELQKYLPALLSYFTEEEWQHLLPQGGQRPASEEVASSIVELLNVLVLFLV